MKTLKTIQAITFSIFFLGGLCAQNRTDEQIVLFSSRIDNPIQIEVVNKGDRVVFYSVNRSFYPYLVRFDFTILQNLMPPIENKYVISHGRNNLFTLTKVDKKLDNNYQYKWSYSFGEPGSKPNFNYPYLVPISPFKRVEPYYLNNEAKSICIKDYFKVNKGDTAFCMRKGCVVAVPNMFHEADRIAKGYSLEIRHFDGTVMIYQNIDPDYTFVKLGQTVFPGEPLGVTNNNQLLKVSLYELKDGGKIGVLNINYFINENRTSVFSDTLKNFTVIHPFDIRTKEMTKREKKKFEKSLKEVKKH